MLAIVVAVLAACAGPSEIPEQPSGGGSASRSLHYPPQAIQLHEEGKAIVHVQMLRDGTLKKAELARSTGYADLDAEAVAVFYRVGKFPPVPDDRYPGKQLLDFNVPIEFALDSSH
jgi:protein TonB